MRFISVLILLLQVLLFSVSVQAEDEYWEYTLRPGDTIWKIAREYTNSVNNWDDIQRLNNIGKGPDRTIPPGTRIKIPVSMLKQKPTPAVVIALSGEVNLIRANGNTEVLVVGSKLYSGDKIVTVDEQNLRIQFADKSELQVFSNSELLFDKLGYHEDTGMVDTRVRLPQGRVKTWVEKLRPQSRYEIETPAAVTAVRGTQYRLSSDQGQITRTEVTEGEVGVSAGGVTQQVSSGFGLMAEKGKPLTLPVKLLDAPVINNNQSTVAGELNITWSILPDAAEYRYQLARDEKFDQIILSSATMTARLIATDLEPGEYYVRVRGIAVNRLEGLDSVRSFAVKKAIDGSGVLQQIILPSGLILMGQ